MHCIADRIEYRRMGIGDGSGHAPEIARRHLHLLGEGARAIHPDDAGILADMRIAGAAEAAGAAGDMTFRRDALADGEAAHPLADRRDPADEFMTRSEERRVGKEGTCSREIE